MRIDVIVVHFSGFLSGSRSYTIKAEVNRIIGRGEEKKEGKRQSKQKDKSQHQTDWGELREETGCRWMPNQPSLRGI